MTIDPKTANSPTVASVLRAAHQAVFHELDRIDKLLSEPADPLEDYQDKLQKRFFDQIEEARNLLLRSLDSINADEHNPETLAAAWRTLRSIQSDHIEPLAEELLAVVGGASLTFHKLDFLDYNVPAAPNQPATELLKNYREHHAQISSSRIAEAITRELDKRAELGWQSVLIVADESPRRSIAQILRLRFPACDVWHLPLIAYEYGYWVASERSKLFTPVRELVKRQAAIGGYDGTLPPPDDEQCFLDEVRRHWKLACDEKKSKGNWHEYVAQHKRDLDKVAELQESFISRLFADAFASFFVGPAYLHALLNFKFGPDPLHSETPDMPSFAERFVVAFEILKWMNDEPLVRRPGDDERPFEREVEEVEELEEEAGQEDDSAQSRGLLQLWKLALHSAGVVGDPYDATFAKFEPWIKEFKKALSQYTFGARMTYDEWREALSLEDKLLSEPMQLATSRPSKLVVINAAWSARWLGDPDKLQLINAHAIQLLNENDNDWRLAAGQRGIPPPLSVTTPVEIVFDAQGVIADILTVLVNDTDLENYDLFQKMIGPPRSIRQDPRLITRLADATSDRYRKRGELLRAYLWLCGEGR
jgi:hypothetical protein